MIHARYGEPSVVYSHNDCRRTIRVRQPQVTTHLHNAHNASESDGNPTDYFGPGTYKTFHYPNKPAGDDRAKPWASCGSTTTAWTTPRRTSTGDWSAPICCSTATTAATRKTNSKAIRLPSGKYDVPLVLENKVYDKNGVAYFDLFNLDGIIGDKFLVNGNVQPYFEVDRRRYRFRLLNTGPSRFYQFKFSNGMKFWQVSNDGNLLPFPIERDQRQHDGRGADGHHRRFLPGHRQRSFIWSTCWSTRTAPARPARS